MPLDATRMVTEGHLIHEDILQFVDLFTGVMADQPVTFNNSVFAGQMSVGGTLNVTGGPSTFEFGAIMSNGAWQGPGSVPPGGAVGQALVKNSATDYDLTWGAGGGGGLTWPLLAPDGSAAAPSYAFASNPATGIYSNGVAVGISTGGTFRAFFGGSIAFNAPLQFSVDNAVDIGASSSARPRNVFIATALTVPQVNTSNVWTPTALLGLGDTTNGTRWQITASDGSLRAFNDGAVDIGAAGAGRPRDIHLQRNFWGNWSNSISPSNNAWFISDVANSSTFLTVVPSGTGNQAGIMLVGNSTATNIAIAVFRIFGAGAYLGTTGTGGSTVIPLNLGTNGLFQWLITTNGTFGAVTDNSLDIGASAANRPRDLFIARFGAIAGTLGIGPGAGSNVAANLTISSTGLVGSPQWGIQVATFLGTMTANQVAGGMYVFVRPNSGGVSMSALYGIWIDNASNPFNSAIAANYGVRIGNQGTTGVANAYGLWIDGQSNASSNNIAIASNGPNHFFNGRANIGGNGAGDNHYYIIMGSTPPSTTLMPTGDQTGVRLEYWANGNCTGAVVGFFAAVLGGAGVQTVNATAIQAGNPGNQGGGIQNSFGIRIDSITSGINNNYALWISNPGGASGDNFSIVFGSANERIRTPKNNAASISIESADGYAFTCGLSGSFMGGNAYYDGTTWQRFSTAQAGGYLSTAAGTLSFATAPSGSNPLGATNKMTIDANGNLMVTGAVSCINGSIYLGPNGATANIVYQSAGNVLLMNNLTASIVTTTNYLLLAGNTTVSGAIGGVVYYHSNMTVYSFLDSGNGYHYANLTLVATGFTPTSARKLKTNIVALDDPLSLVLDDRVHGVRYTEIQSGKPKVGFVADDWVGVEPSVVSFDHNDEIETLDYDRISAITFEALKQHAIQTNTRLEALERKLAA